MIGVGRQVRVIGTALVTDSWRTTSDTQTVQWASVSKYDPGVNEGASVYSTKHYYTRFLEDTYGTFDFYLQLSGPATGKERIRWSVAGADTAFVEFDQTRVGSSGSLEVAPVKGRDQVRFRATIKERGAWFAPRRMVLTLDSADYCELADGPTTLVLVIYSKKDPPRLTMTGGGAFVAGKVDVDFNIVTSGGAAYDMSSLIDPITVWFRVYEPGDIWKVPKTNRIRKTGDVDTDPRNQKVTFTSASPATQTVEFTAYSGSGDHIIEALVERPGVKYQGEQFDADTGIKDLTGLDVHQDENQWYFSNDYALLRQDNYGLYDKDGWTPGYPTGYGYGGHTATTESLDFVRFESQTAASPVTDPITGNAMEWWVNADQVTAGPSYTRQLFTVQYCGGPWIGHIPPGGGTNFVRAAYRIEPFKTEDVDHQHEIVSVGYRARQVARSSSVQFRMRNVVGANGYGKFPASYNAQQPFVSWTLTTPWTYGDTVTFTDYEGTTLDFTAGIHFAMGSTAEEAATNFVNVVNSAAIKLSAQKSGALVAVRQGETIGVHPGAPSYSATGDYTDRSFVTNLGFDSRTGLTAADKSFKSTAIVDASGNDVRATAVGGTSTGEYYYDEETGTEIWFWSMKNMWGRNAGWTGATGLTLTSAPERLTTSVWNKWYGVRRDPIWGLTLWMTNFVPDEPASFNPTDPIPVDSAVYRYNEGDSVNTRAFTAWSNSSHPPSRTPVAAGGHGWLMESSETGYYPEGATWNQADAKGYDFADYSKCLMVFNPVWVSSYDGSDDVTTFNDVKTNSLGNLIHSIQMQIDTQAQFYNANTGTWPDFFPAQLYNWWSPRGNCTAYTSTRPNVTVTI